jgi:RNA polymerase sigma-70 factor (ECF subfamily)
MENLTDGELATRANRGDREAYGELVRRSQESVFNVCYRMLGERREAEDLTQEAYLRAYQRLASFDPGRPFGPWIRRVAANLCLNHLKAAHNPLLEAQDAPEDWPGPAELDPSAIQEEAESTRSLRRLITAMPPVHRAVIELAHFQDLSYTEISQTLNIPVSDVKSYLFRARRLLAERIKTHAPS